MNESEHWAAAKSSHRIHYFFLVSVSFARLTSSKLIFPSSFIPSPVILLQRRWMKWGGYGGFRWDEGKNTFQFLFFNFLLILCSWTMRFLNGVSRWRRIEVTDQEAMRCWVSGTKKKDAIECKKILMQIEKFCRSETSSNPRSMLTDVIGNYSDYIIRFKLTFFTKLRKMSL